ncbi:MAG: MBOAT family O-acyltransferase [Bacteroidota bacterium]
MQFNSIIFITLFLPVFLGIYYLLPQKGRNAFLVLFSLLFYTWGEKILVLVLLLSTIVNYWSGIGISKGYKKTGLYLGLLANILILGLFKYYNFGATIIHEICNSLSINFAYFKIIPGLILPIGISFYTFRAISYLIDVYKGKSKASTNFIEFATFLTMFPLLLAGPIVRYSEIQNQIIRSQNISLFIAGIERFIIGLGKKMLLANTFASIADKIFDAQISDISSINAWIGISSYTLQIYYDFSAYSDMAIGLGNMLGFNIPENFNYPYVSKNIREFWKRWHITLSVWLRDYIFMPFAYSFSRKLKREKYLNVRSDHIIYSIAIFITFLICGIWHGASWNFIAWGLWYGIFILLEHFGLGKKLKKIWIPLQHIYTLFVIMLGWVIFRTNSLHESVSFMNKLFSFTAGDRSLNSYIHFFTINAESVFITLLGILFCTPIWNFIQEKADILREKSPYFKIAVSTFASLLLIGIFIVSLSYITAGTFNVFIYFKF